MKLLLVDTSALIHRAYHAYPDSLTLNDGTPINAVYGFTQLLIQAIENVKPEYVICALDTGKPTVRHIDFVDYKAHRKPVDQNLIVQFPLVEKIIDVFDIPLIKLDGFEADDIIGTLSVRLYENYDKIIILTGDSDQYQLANDKVSIYMAGRTFKDSKIFSNQDLIKKLGFDTKYIPDWKGLKGDASDNIPGIPGIGEKSATDLIIEFGSIENIYQNIDSTKPNLKTKLVNGHDIGMQSKELATIILDVPIPENLYIDKFEFKDFDIEKVRILFREYKFRSLADKLDNLKKINIINEQLIISSVFDKKTSSKSTKKDAKHIKSIHFNEVDDEIIGFAIKDNLHHCDIISEKLIFTEKTKFFDIQNALFLITYGDFKLNFAEAALEYLDVDLTEDNMNDSEKMKDILYKFKKYVLNIFEDKQSLYNLFTELEMPLIPVLYDMESTGIILDKDHMINIGSKIDEKLVDITKEIYKEVGHEFNIASPKQIGEILVDHFQIPLKKKSKSGQYGTDEDILSKYADSFPIIQKILYFRELSKLKSTYIEGLLNSTDEENVIHTTYNQAQVSTGRLSSTNPNLQNIPKGGEFGDDIRNCFIARNGYELLHFDYVQQELRILAHLSNDENLLDAYSKHLDIHKLTASRIFNTPYDQVTKDQRNSAKTINFGIVYGMGSTSLSQSLKISTKDAQNFIDKFFGAFPKLKLYFEYILNTETSEYVETIMGRRRSKLALSSKIPMLVSLKKRELMNFPIQGSAADQTKKSMIDIDKWIKYNNYQNDVRILLQIHDELVIEIKIDLVDIVKKQIIDIMQNTIQLKCPVLVENK